MKNYQQLNEKLKRTITKKNANTKAHNFFFKKNEKHKVQNM